MKIRKIWIQDGDVSDISDAILNESEYSMARAVGERGLWQSRRFKFYRTNELGPRRGQQSRFTVPFEFLKIALPLSTFFGEVRPPIFHNTRMSTLHPKIKKLTVSVQTDLLLFACQTFLTTAIRGKRWNLPTRCMSLPRVFLVAPLF